MKGKKFSSTRSNNERFEIKGKIWWGFRWSNDIPVKDNNVEKAKEKFIAEKSPKEIENFSLFLNKYVPIIDAEIKDNIYNKEEVWFSIKETCIGGDSKKYFLKQLIEKFKNSFTKYAENLKTKINSQIEALKKQKYIYVFPESLSLHTSSRLIIGLGSDHVLETSLTLHHIYGIPYIPASALKGICRMAAFWKIAENKNILNNEKQLNELQNKFYGDLCPDEKDILRYQLLFGAQNFKGLLLFLDAYPVIEENTQIFDLDIMNVHYQKYYSEDPEKNPPGDWENPVPIVFLTVKEGVEFKFNILFDEFRANKILEMDDETLKKTMPLAVRDILKEFKDKLNNLQNEIKPLLEKALKEFGIGAKTRLGYGIFE
ncbi:MAG: type III-B CRISPR module RAMP protein Cmr6 [Candidatus Ratteibacteria bacterium]